MSGMSGNPHAAVAKFRQEGVHEWQSYEGSTDATDIAAILDAQVEATLALAYEQRTANLIAFYGDGHIGPLDTAHAELHKQIIERLGLA
jgi:hypothetical protein